MLTHVSWSAVGALLLATLVPSVLRLSGERAEHVAAFRWVIVYTLWSSVLFLQVPFLYAWLANRPEVLETAGERPDLAVVVLAAAALVELASVAIFRGLFFRILAASICHSVASVIALGLASYGIINFVWMTIFSGALAGFMVATAMFRDLERIVQETELAMDQEHRKNVFLVVRNESNQLLKFGVQAFLALGASLGVSMSILFRDGQVGWSQPDYQMNGARLVAGFFLIAVGLALWIVKPYLASFVKVREHFRTERARWWLMSSK